MADKKQDAGGVFTGRTRLRTPKRSVLIADRVARWVIALGGIGSIAAVSLVGLFLLYVVIPLFVPSDVAEERALSTGSVPARVAHVALNEHGTMTWTLHRDGSIFVRRLADGRVIKRAEVPDAADLTCWSFGISDDRCAFGYADGSVRFGRLGFGTQFLEPDQVTDALKALKPGQSASFRDGVAQRTPENQFRFQFLQVELEEPLPLTERPIVRIDQTTGNRGTVFAALDADGLVHVREVRERRNLLTGKTTRTLVGQSVDLRAAGRVSDRDPSPTDLLLTGLGDNVYVVWSDGRLLRLDTSDPRVPEVVEEVDLVPEAGHRITAISWQIGRTSLAVGDDLGRVRIWFRVADPAEAGADGLTLALVHDLAGHDAVATALAPSARTRMLAAGFADGAMALYHVTSEQRLALNHVDEDGDAVEIVAVGPREDMLLTLAQGTTKVWRIDAPHPETNWTSLMGKVWYEGYSQPEYVWQSSAATDSFEPKYSLMPLIFGTLKATLYSLLFGLPLAWAAAIYTSQFLHPRSKARIKPVIELMASLPSVVLGFLAALIFAPFLEKLVPETLTAFITVPFCFLLGAQLWQLLPKERALHWSRFKFPLMFLGLPAGLILAGVLAPGVVSMFFAGDVVAWLDGQIGNGIVGWMFILLPLSGLVMFLFNSMTVDDWLRRSGRGWSRMEFALIDLARFLASAVLTLLVAWGASWLLTSAGLDPRGSYVDTYVQRNALVVGVVMGFAIIPIIYTISEDALSAVPEHLRAASLGAGATPWQTAIRVIIPPAVSGLFSAMMIGLGRAVGETMIVLMAAGNTPVMEWNIFNGFRTLSANIAVELPEAVQNSTHYRTLFLAALTLFVMTFILNTAAEAVRIRFRKKSLEL
jgi:phosphate transport system permease protein